MIDLDTTPSRYRGTIEVYATVDEVFDEATCEWVLATEWRWRCKSNNHTILASGQGYSRRAGALKAIDAMFGARLKPMYRRYVGDNVRITPQNAVLPWRLVIHDRHGNTTTGAVY